MKNLPLELKAMVESYAIAGDKKAINNTIRDRFHPVK